MQHTEAELIASCAYLVRHIASRIAHPHWVEYEDLVSAGSIGLLDAARTYDPARGTRFTTHAYPRIRGALWKAVEQAEGGYYQRDQRHALTQAADRIREETGREPDDDALCRVVGISRRRLWELRASAHPASFDALLPSGQRLADFVPDPAPTPEERLIQTECLAALARLPERERLAVEMHILGGQQLRDVGRAIGRSSEGARRAVERGLEWLREALAG